MRNRRGFSLTELIVSVVVLTVVAGGIAEAMRRQQQVFRSIALMVGARADVRDAAEVLASDLAIASPLDTITLAADSAVEFFSTVAQSVSCDSAPAYTIRLPPEKTGNSLRLTSMLATPDTGDVVLLYVRDGTAVDGGRWDRHAIAAVSSQQAGTACPASTGFTEPSDAALPSQVIALKSAASDSVRAGAPVRIIRRVRHSLYRSGDAKWYLGSRRCNAFGAPACGMIQPLSGPYAAHSPGQGGLVFKYFDDVGGALSPSGAMLRTARVHLAVRGRASPLVRAGRGRRGVVLVLSMLAVVVAGALIVATHVAVSLEHSVAANAIARHRAFTASEYALWTTVATWDGSYATLPRGGAATSVIYVLRDSALVTAVRLGVDLYWLVADAGVGEARRRTGINVKVTADSTGTSVQPLRRSWVEVH